MMELNDRKPSSHGGTGPVRAPGGGVNALSPVPPVYSSPTVNGAIMDGWKTWVAHAASKSANGHPTAQTVLIPFRTRTLSLHCGKDMRCAF